MSKLKTVAEILGVAVETCVKAVTADSGLFIFSKKGAIGLAIGGNRNDLLPFLEEAIKRLQMVVDSHKNGKISLSDDDYRVYTCDENKNMYPIDDRNN